MAFPRFAVFYDFHTSPACGDVGMNFDCAAVARRLASRGVEFTTFAARCNQGLAYYDTRVGIRHPALRYDLLRRFADACHAEGILVGAYLNAGLSHEEGLRHRDWLTIAPNGEIYRQPRTSPHYRTMCYNSPYAGHFLSMLDELLPYPMDGFFFDCLAPHPCIGAECAAEMKRRDLDVDAFARVSQLDFARRIAEKLRSAGRDLLIYFNGVRWIDQLDWATYLELECLPTYGWGYEALPPAVRHLRTLGKPLLNMTGRFHEAWGDFGGIRTHSSVLFDCVTGLANTLPPDIGDHFHPRGDMNHAVYDLIGGVYGELAPLTPWTDGAAAETEIALIVPPDAFDSTIPAIPSLNSTQGWTRLLCELHQQFDVLLPEQDFGRYALLVLADDVRLDEPLRTRMEAWLARGGKIIASGRSGLETGRESFPSAWEAVCAGDSPHQPAYFRLVDRKDARFAGVPDMPVKLPIPGVVLRPGGARAVAEIIAPYFNAHADLERCYYYTPPDKPDGAAALTMSSSVAHFSFPVGLAYNKHAQLPVRSLVAGALAAFLPAPLVRLENVPAFGRATVTSQPGRRMVWLTAFVPERRGEKKDIIEEGMELHRVTVGLRRVEDEELARVYTVPDGRDLLFREEDGYWRVELPAFRGYVVLAFENVKRRIQ